MQQSYISKKVVSSKSVLIQYGIVFKVRFYCQYKSGFIFHRVSSRSFLPRFMNSDSDLRDVVVEVAFILSIELLDRIWSAIFIPTNLKVMIIVTETNITYACWFKLYLVYCKVKFVSQVDPFRLQNMHWLSELL